MIPRPYTLAELEAAEARDLAACNTAFERSIARAVMGQYVRERASATAATRPLSGRELAFAQSHGWRQ